MTDPRHADGFQVGDFVRVKHRALRTSAEGVVTGHATSFFGLRVAIGAREYELHPTELELLDAQKMDEPVPADPAMPAELAGQAEEGRRGAGTGTEYPEQAEGSVSDAAFPLDVQTARLRRRVEALTKRVSRLEQGESNEPA